jgi:hypothetical protein
MCEISNMKLQQFRIRVCAMNFSCIHESPARDGGSIDKQVGRRPVFHLL